MAVTAVRAIRNNIADDLNWSIRNAEHPSDPGLTLRYGEAGRCNMWIPWCTDNYEFDHNHHIDLTSQRSDSHGQIQLNQLYIWQHGDYVIYGTSFDSGELVFGNCTVGGDRSVVIEGTWDDPYLQFY